MLPSVIILYCFFFLVETSKTHEPQLQFSFLAFNRFQYNTERDSEKEIKRHIDQKWEKKRERLSVMVVSMVQAGPVMELNPNQ